MRPLGTFNWKWFAIWSALVTVALAACGSELATPGATSTMPEPTSALVPTSSPTVEPTPIVDLASLLASVDDSIVAANTSFGFRLFSELTARDTGQSVFISPLSVSTALAMTYNGAAGGTQRAMAQALGLDGMELDKVNASSAALLRSLDALNPVVELSIANSLWARQGEPFSGDFLDRNQRYYGAEIATLDFGDPKSADVINGWIDTKTKGKIDRMIGKIKPSTVMMLINAIYFKGKWHTPFDPERTTDRAFHLADGTEKLHPMMSQSGRFRHLNGEGFQAVKLAYDEGGSASEEKGGFKDTRVGMYVFLPDADSSLEEFLGELDAESWETWMAQFEVGQGKVVIPRFKLEYSSKLNDALKALGMGVAFGGSADFSAMAPRGLWIDEVSHKAVVEVNEEGTEAAAATVVAMAESMAIQRIDFVADRPFFFAIRDDTTGTVLFMGALFEPEE